VGGLNEEERVTLGELIKRLSKESADKVVPLGFAKPHSYRGFYDELAFEPVKNITVGEMLKAAKKALGATYTGYKGGEYKMKEWTDVWLAYYGQTGESIGPILLDYMLGKYSRPSHEQIQRNQRGEGGLV